MKKKLVSLLFIVAIVAMPAFLTSCGDDEMETIVPPKPEPDEPKEDKFEILLRNIRDHHFLHYYPYILEDNVIIEDAEKRAQNFEKYPNYDNRFFKSMLLYLSYWEYKKRRKSVYLKW